ncbi:protein GET1-like [Salvia hispanica]|uniref:protein GET1-like n=1 Tax=Salvia splendens TaxID=180675 RepID=UPI001C278AAB|nr:protein GET1-like [Salvia splendens]XP_047977190.1 protein GET1-like [Salvia hispanica]
MEDIQTEQRKSIAAPVIFILVFAFHFISKYIESQKNKKGSGENLDAKLRREIKQLLKEASTLSQPSTFAQAAKLRRTAAAKEKELAKYLEMQEKDMKLSVTSYGKHLMISKVFTYFVLILWFWKIPVATISDQLVHPFGRLLSWRAGNSLKDSVVIGVIPWLIVSTRVSKFICRKVFE